MCVSVHSRGSGGRERSEKPVSSGLVLRPAALLRRGSSKELLEGTAPEEPHRDGEREDPDEGPRRPSVSEDKTETERSRAREPGEGGARSHILWSSHTHTYTYTPLPSFNMLTALPASSL